MPPLGGAGVMKRYDGDDDVGAGYDYDYYDASGTVGIVWPIHVDRRWQWAFEWHSLMLEHDGGGVHRFPATLKRVTLSCHLKSCCCCSYSCSAADKIHSSAAAGDDYALQPPPPLHFAPKSIGQHSTIRCYWACNWCCRELLWWVVKNWNSLRQWWWL